MRALILVVAVLGAWWWFGDDDENKTVAVDRNEQAAVLRDGFAWRVGRTVRVLDRKGGKRAEHAIDRDGDVRVVGTRGGPAAAWLDKGQMRFVDIKNGKTIGVWGKDARTLCDGVATNDERFAVGWLEGDGRMWWVHGDTRPTSDIDALDADLVVDAAGELLAAEPRDWCGIASAGDRVAIMWREKNRLFINSCTRKKCDSLPAAVTLGEHTLLLAFGCVARSCMLAVQERNGTVTFSYITESGGTKWTKPLPKTARDISIVGVGKTSFALAYTSDDGTEVLHAEKKAKTSRLWHTQSGRAPVIAWSLGQLFIGHGDQTTIVPLPE